MVEAAGKFEIGVDIGGTFTDVVCRDGTGTMRLVKIPTTRAQSERRRARLRWTTCSANGACRRHEIVRFVHGTTVATNAVLERKGAKIGLLTTAGFKDVLEIGRQMRHKVYDLVLKPETPVFLAPGRVAQARCASASRPRARFSSPLDEDARCVTRSTSLSREGVEAIAVCYLFSFLNPRARAARRARSSPSRHPRPHASRSPREVDPAFREYERTVRHRLRCLSRSRWSTAISQSMEQDLAAARRSGAAADHAVARRHRVLRASRAAAAGAALPLGARRRRHRRPRWSAARPAIDDLITVDIGGTQRRHRADQPAASR